MSHSIDIREEAGVRYLHFGTDWVQGAMRLSKPNRLVLAYTQAIVRVYNLEGRRDNKYKARIKILVHEKGESPMRDAVEAEFAARPKGELTLPAEEVARIKAYFQPPALPERAVQSEKVAHRAAHDERFRAFVAANVSEHKTPG